MKVSVAKYFSIPFAVVVTALMSSCVMGPRMDVDTDRLGNQPLGRLIAKTWMLPETMIHEELVKLLAGHGKNECRASIACLEKLGFQDCEQRNKTISCDHSGEVRTTLTKSRDEKVESHIRIQVRLNVNGDAEIVVKKIGSI